jgi:hypothetical protein
MKGQNILFLEGKKKAILVTFRGAPKVREISRLPNSLDNWLTDGGEFANLICQSPFTVQEYT